MTEAQGHYLISIQQNDITFGLGPAGVGKTWLSAAWAAQELEAKRIERIVITRPAKEAGEEFGFLPGELHEKYEPYLAPLRDVFEERLGKSTYEYLVQHGRIAAIPLAFMRGITLKNAVVLLDEAQNVTPVQMRMFLTRIGQGTKMIVDGDPDQKDIEGQSGLTYATSRLRGLAGVGIVEFDRSDIVRHGLVQDILERLSN